MREIYHKFNLDVEYSGLVHWAKWAKFGVWFNVLGTSVIWMYIYNKERRGH